VSAARSIGRAALLTAGFSALVILSSTPARSDDPVTSSVRFNREIVRIFERKCLPCHAPGAIAMSLATHRDARPWARAIREEIVEQRMPPWSAARGSVRFAGDIGLTPRELTTILTWVDGGVPKGDEADLPPVTPPAARAPSDLTLPLPAQSVPGSGADVVRRVTIPTGLGADRWVRQIRIEPGDRRLLRAAFATIVPATAQSARVRRAIPVWAASWTPWQTAIAPPEDAAFLVPAGSRILVELHYRGLDAPATDRSSVELSYADTREWNAASSLRLDATARTSARRHTGARVIPRETTVWAIRPERLTEGQSLENHRAGPGRQRAGPPVDPRLPRRVAGELRTRTAPEARRGHPPAGHRHRPAQPSRAGRRPGGAVLISFGPTIAVAPRFL
jgi:hypothetical protein